MSDGTKWRKRLTVVNQPPQSWVRDPGTASHCWGGIADCEGVRNRQGAGQRGWERWQQEPRVFSRIWAVTKKQQSSLTETSSKEVVFHIWRWGEVVTEGKAARWRYQVREESRGRSPAGSTLWRNIHFVDRREVWLTIQRKVAKGPPTSGLQNINVLKLLGKPILFGRTCLFWLPRESNLESVFSSSPVNSEGLGWLSNSIP